MVKKFKVKAEAVFKILARKLLTDAESEKKCIKAVFSQLCENSDLKKSSLNLNSKVLNEKNCVDLFEEFVWSCSHHKQGRPVLSHDKYFRDSEIKIENIKL